MSESLILRSADVEPLAERIAAIVAAIVAAEVSKQLEASKKRLVDRFEMAERASVSVPSLDRLVANGSVPSVKVGSRRLFDPDAVFSALSDG